ncbi:hypothetical protein HDU83_006914, partial [Entophlyctis luteolus]
VGSKDIASVVSEVVRRELMLLMEPENTLSPVAIGFRCLDELRRASRFTSIPESEGPAILSVENAALTAEIPDEKLVDQFTRIFGKILLPDLIVVNSEEYNWLQQASYLPDKINLKPDLFTTYQGLFCQRNEPNDKVTDLRQFYRHSKEQVFYFGVPEISLLDSNVIMEAKKELSVNDDFGKVVVYLQKLPGSSRAVLFDKFECWLIESFQKVVVQVSTMQWTDSGARKVFTDFVEGGLGDYVALLSSACSELKVRTVNHNAFLGAGSNGRVCEVLCEDGTSAALKISTKEKMGNLLAESLALVRASNTGVVATVVIPFTLINNETGAAILISPVGKPVLQSTLTADYVFQIVGSLFKLHLEGVVHGDPSLANIIMHEDKFLWIDLMGSFEGSISWESDASILACSILNLPNQTALPPDVSALVRSYASSRNEVSWQALARELWNQCPKL